MSRVSVDTQFKLQRILWFGSAAESRARLAGSNVLHSARSTQRAKSKHWDSESSAAEESLACDSTGICLLTQILATPPSFYHAQPAQIPRPDSSKPPQTPPRPLSISHSRHFYLSTSAGERLVPPTASIVSTAAHRPSVIPSAVSPVSGRFVCAKPPSSHFPVEQLPRAAW
ncbi:hypothetical protein VTJ49DRAFT_700 [Mycothermus thermophilus]|uniref:Uncharacterized protein n=1 Tax=Humicola insolens TaxID=85995 RepID=A0ABR3VES8_HUMIN